MAFAFYSLLQAFSLPICLGGGRNSIAYERILKARAHYLSLVCSFGWNGTDSGQREERRSVRLTRLAFGVSFLCVCVCRGDEISHIYIPPFAKRREVTCLRFRFGSVRIYLLTLLLSCLVLSCLTRGVDWLSLYTATTCMNGTRIDLRRIGKERKFQGKEGRSEWAD
ncbi:hypothetical protein EV127DRAFT_211763 [Xylaria flabelliformis]|nr:hypothetical protein EV127DRAFT_211763 [Xylaria flabelliformis]